MWISLHQGLPIFCGGNPVLETSIRTLPLTWPQRTNLLFDYIIRRGFRALPTKGSLCENEAQPYEKQRWEALTGGLGRSWNHFEIKYS